METRWLPSSALFSKSCSHRYTLKKKNHVNDIQAHTYQEFFLPWNAQAGLELKIAVVQTAYANGSSTHYLENTMKVTKKNSTENSGVLFSIYMERTVLTDLFDT